MAIIKKNLLSIIFGVIALLAVIASYYPLGGYVTELQGKLTARTRTASEIDSMLTKQRTLPVVSLDASSAEPLKAFPSPEIIKLGEDMTKQVAAESLAMRDAAVKMNMHELLVPGALPDGSTPKKIEFRDKYRQDMPVGPTGPTWNDVSTVPIPKIAKAMKATLPVASGEVGRVQAEEATRIEKEKTILLADGKIGNRYDVEQMKRERNVQIPEEMQLNRAKGAMIYIDPGAFDVNTTIAGSTAPDPFNIFMAQVSLWVQQDITKAIAETNSLTDPATGQPPKNVMEAPVKHLQKIVVQPWFSTHNVNMSEGSPSDPDALLPKQVTISPTGRYSNGLFDVIHYYMLIDIEADKIPVFLETLSKNRFMTIYKLDLKSLDSATIYASGLRYGNKPVVSLSMEGEALFFRKWTEPLMSNPVKQRLGTLVQQ